MLVGRRGHRDDDDDAEVAPTCFIFLSEFFSSPTKN